MKAVIKGAGYILCHTPDMVIHNGSTQTTERIVNPEGEYLKALPNHLRTFEQNLNYWPNQVYIGNYTPDDLAEVPQPWYDKQCEITDRYGKFGISRKGDDTILLYNKANVLIDQYTVPVVAENVPLVRKDDGSWDTAIYATPGFENTEAGFESWLKSVGAETPSVYLAGNSSMLSTAGNAMYQSDMIRLAGGINVAADIKDAYWAQIDYEQLLTWNPDYIILASSAQYTVEDVLEDPNLAGCTAVVNGNVYQIPCDAESWDSPVPSSILGALWLAGILHPALLTGADCAAIMDEYYETFYQFTYSKK